MNRSCSKSVEHRRVSRLWIIGAAITVALGCAPLQSQAQESPAHPCTPGRDCHLPTVAAESRVGQVYALSYGSADSMQNIFFSTGSDSTVQLVPAVANGGLHVGSPEFMLQATTLPPVPVWKACSLDSQGDCTPNIVPNTYRIARFGRESRWIYQAVASSFSCPAQNSPATDFAGLRYDPSSGGTLGSRSNYTCQYSNNPIYPVPGAYWRGCAASTATRCDFNGSGTYLVRFLDGGSGASMKPRAYRTVTGTGITCSGAAFGVPETPNGIQACETLTIQSFLAVRNDWQLVGLCENCGDVNFAVTAGVERGSVKETESSFAWQLGYSASASVGSYEGSFSANYSRDSRNIVNNSFTQKAGSNFFVECGAGALYQWVTEVEERCLPGGSSDCVSVARGKIFRCLPTRIRPTTPPLGIQVSGANVAPALSASVLAEPAQLAVDVADRWALTSTKYVDDFQVARLDSGSEKWELAPGAAARIGGSQTEPWVMTAGGGVFRWTGSAFEYLPGRVARDVGDGWIVSNEPTDGGYRIYRFNKTTKNWDLIPGGVVRIGGTYDNPWAVNFSGHVFEYVNDGWLRREGILASDVGQGWALQLSGIGSMAGSAIYRFDPNGNAFRPSWIKMEPTGGASTRAIAIGGTYRNPAVVTVDGLVRFNFFEATWTHCASEGETCDLVGARGDILYGTGENHIVRRQTGDLLRPPVACTTATFGGVDPASGFVKTCAVR